MCENQDYAVSRLQESLLLLEEVGGVDAINLKNPEHFEVAQTLINLAYHLDTKIAGEEVEVT